MNFWEKYLKIKRILIAGLDDLQVTEVQPISIIKFIYVGGYEAVG
jgi:hypothetical protein